MRRLTTALLGFICGVAATLSIIAAGWLAPLLASTPQENWGTFPVPAQLELLDDGRQAKLLADFVYLDPRKKAWTAIKNSVVNGASIPAVFWSITGSPFVGKYRNASIVHDEGCLRMAEPWQDVHRMFYEASRCGGVPEHQAKVLYAAVYHFGPRWTIKPVMEVRTSIGEDGEEEVLTVTRTVADVERSTQETTAAMRDKLQAYIEGENPSIADIESLNLDSL